MTQLLTRRTLALAIALAATGLIAAAPFATAATVSAHPGRPAGTAAKHKPRAPHRRKKATPLPPPALKMIWGPLTLPDGSSAFPVYHQLGVRVLETQLVWARTAPTRPSEPGNPADPAYRWPPELEQMISQAAQWGITVAVLVKGTPGWANGGMDETWAPTNANEYGSFMQAAARRYPTVHYWMIWGEPNGPNFNPMPSNSPVGPRRYALLLEAAYSALKGVSSSNLVIGGMTWTDGPVKPPDFIRWMRLPDGAPPRLDYYGQNPYSTRFPKLTEGPALELPDVEELDQLKRKHARLKLRQSKLRDINDLPTLHSELAVAYRHLPGGTPKLWLSEFSISSDSANYAFNYFVSRPAQARWVTAAFKLVDSVSYVVGLGWYELLDQPASVPGHLTEGLLTESGAHKPAFSAYAHAP